MTLTNKDTDNFPVPVNEQERLEDILAYDLDNTIGATGLDQVFAKRANLPFGGTQGLGTGAPAQQISPADAEVINSGLSNTHSSGAFSLTWDFEVPGSVNLGGSALRRFM